MPNEKLPAEVRKIIPTADRQKATVKVKVRFLDIDPRILPDMSAKVTFIQKSESAAKDRAFESHRSEVGDSAARRKDGCVRITDDRVLSQTVTVGGEFGDRVEIKQGLAGGETVIVRGGENLTDGSRVKVKTGS